VAVFIGAIVRCIVSNSIGKSIVKIGAMSIIVIVKMFSAGSSRPVGCGISTAVGVVLSGLAVSLLIDEFPEKILFYALYGIISGFTAYSASELIRSISKKGIVELQGISGCACGILYVVLISALCSADIPYLNAGLILGASVTLAGSYFHGSMGGIICGALTAGGAVLASSEIGLTASVLPLAGFISGIAFRGKIFFSAVFFSLTIFMLTVLLGESASAELTMNIILGASVFVATAPYYSDKWIHTDTTGNNNIPNLREIKQNFLSGAIEAVRLDSQKISAALSAVNDDDISIKRTAGAICRSCYKRGLCSNEMSEISDELIPILPADCAHKQEVLKNLEIELRNRTARQLMHLRYSEDLKLMNEHLKITEELMRGAGKQEDFRYSASVSKKILQKLKSYGFNPLRATAGYNSANRLIAEIFFDIEDTPDSNERICSLISDELEKKLLPSDMVSSSSEIKTGVYEPPRYELDIYTASVCAKGSSMSGDSHAVFTGSSGKNFVILSDGMGSGKSAAVDSRMVINLFRRLICSGMELKPAVRLINSLMITKSREESFATLDVLEFDPDLCCAVSVKSGAAPTIIRKGNDVIKLTSSTFPIGIVEEAELTISENKFSDGDMIIMFSDGISENAYLFIKELLIHGS
ncbi:MAG: SpoIIE family protein phosphatase, partial [Ruminococcus sp.]|nr:SpoIIE family protein phosphatase [Ruminococcus sp.]